MESSIMTYLWIRCLNIRKSFKNQYSMAKKIANQAGYSFPRMTLASCRSLSKWIETISPFSEPVALLSILDSRYKCRHDPTQLKRKKRKGTQLVDSVCLETLAATPHKGWPLSWSSSYSSFINGNPFSEPLTLLLSVF